MTGVEQICGVVGGFHLTGPSFEPIIPPTLDALEALRPALLICVERAPLAS